MEEWDRKGVGSLIGVLHVSTLIDYLTTQQNKIFCNVIRESSLFILHHGSLIHQTLNFDGEKKFIYLPTLQMFDYAQALPNLSFAAKPIKNTGSMNN